MFIFIRDTIININMVESMTVSGEKLVISPPDYQGNDSGYYEFKMESKEESEKFLKYISDAIQKKGLLIDGK